MSDTSNTEEEVVEFGDIDADDVYTEGDDEVDWSQVETLQQQVDEINAIGDEEERRGAAEHWASALGGDN